MGDPYRQSSEDGGAEILARRSPWIVGGTVVLTAAGTLAPLFRETLAAFNEIVALTGVLFSPVAAFILIRSLRRLSVPQQISAHETGLRLAWPEPIPFVPWMRQRDAFVRWEDIRDVKTSTFSVNGISDTKLVITTADGAVDVPEDGFDVTLQHVQARILDALARRREHAMSDAGLDPAPRAGELSRRYAEPQVLRARQAGNVGTMVFLLVIGGAPTVLAVAVPHWFLVVLAGGCVLLFGSIAVMVASGARQTRVLRLDRDGVHVGPSTESGVSIPWRDLRVRKRVVNHRTVAVSLRGADGQQVSLGGNYGVDCDQLAAMLDPT